jgi:hypothetical protein
MMKKATVPLVLLMILLLGSVCVASQPAVIGGVRDGVALGLMLESATSNGTTIRLGFEANTSNTPGLVFIGGKWFLSNVSSRFPMYLSGGLVAYLGNYTTAGPYISLIFDHFLEETPLFLEVGIDVVKSGRLQLQLGYFF